MVYTINVPLTADMLKEDIGIAYRVAQAMLRLVQELNKITPEDCQVTMSVKG